MERGSWDPSAQPSTAHLKSEAVAVDWIQYTWLDTATTSTFSTSIHTLKKSHSQIKFCKHVELFTNFLTCYIKSGHLMAKIQEEQAKQLKYLNLDDEIMYMKANHVFLPI